MKTAFPIVGVMVAASMAGCASSAEQPTPGGENNGEHSSVASPETPSVAHTAADETDPANVVFTQTVVKTNPDGTKEVITTPITLAEELAENSEREAIAAGRSVMHTMRYDAGCSGSSNWLYDQPGFQGNRICFANPSIGCDIDNLSSYSRGTITCYGTVYTTKWAGGPWGCGFLSGVILASTDQNFVQSIWTGSDPQGIGFWYSGGGFDSNYPLAYHQYSPVSPAGRDVHTCH